MNNIFNYQPNFNIDQNPGSDTENMITLKKFENLTIDNKFRYDYTEKNSLNSSTCSKTGGTTSAFSSPIMKQSESVECQNHDNLKLYKKASEENFDDV